MVCLHLYCSILYATHQCTNPNDGKRKTKLIIVMLVKSDMDNRKMKHICTLHTVTRLANYKHLNETFSLK